MKSGCIAIIAITVLVLIYMYNHKNESFYGNGGGEKWNGRRRSYRKLVDGEVKDPDTLPMFAI